MTIATGHRYGTKADAIAVVIINYNTCQELQACLSSIKSEEIGEVVVVDNNSSDGSVEMVKAKYPLGQAPCQQDQPRLWCRSKPGDCRLHCSVCVIGQ